MVLLVSLSTMTVETQTGLSTEVTENSEVEIEETNELILTSLEDQEKDGEVCHETVSDTEENSGGEVKDAGESSYVFITKESDSAPEPFDLEEEHIDEEHIDANYGGGLELEGDVIRNKESELENCELEKAEYDVTVQEDLELEIDDCPVNNTQLGIECTDCSLETTEGEGKKDGDSSYVFIDMVSNEPTERAHIIEGSKLSDFPQSVIVGSVICGMHQIPTSGFPENSHCSSDNAKSETEMENSSSDISSHHDMLTIDSPSRVEDVYPESEVGSSPRNADITFSSSSYNSDEKVDEKMEKRPIFRYLIKVPWYVDDTIRQQIDFAQQQVDEATKLRDAVRANVIKMKASCNEYRDIYEASKSGIRAAYDALHLKRQEIDSAQSILNRINNAISIEQIDNSIRNMQHMMEHETISLKEEKQLLREIKQLRFYRQQLRSSLDKQGEQQPTFDQKEELEERLKLLKRDLDSARKEIVQTEGVTNNAKKIYFDENEKLRDLQSQFESADDLRQDAYAHLMKLKKQLYDKNKYFRMYKDDARKAENYGFSGDREALHSHCVNQVEKIMELWNKNDDFRNDYIRCNTISTVRRFGTLDGRSLGPDEDPPLLQKIGDGKLTGSPAASTEMNPILPVPTFEQVEPVQTLGPENAEDKSAVKEKQKLKTAQSNEAAPSILNNFSATAYDEMEVEKKVATENEQTQENATVYGEKTRKNEELGKEEVLRKEVAAAKIREQSLLEERAKVKEAEERKRRSAEKAQVRAELKAQKEAEHKEKVRAKKERRKASKIASKGISEQETSGPHSESTLPESTLTREHEIEVKPKTTATRTMGSETGEKQTKTASKRSSSLSTKQTKVVPPPPSLLNKNKKKMQPWMRDLLIALVAGLAALIFFASLGQKPQKNSL